MSLEGGTLEWYPWLQTTLNSHPAVSKLKLNVIALAPKLHRIHFTHQIVAIKSLGSRCVYLRRLRVVQSLIGEFNYG